MTLFPNISLKWLLAFPILVVIAFALTPTIRSCGCGPDREDDLRYDVRFLRQQIQVYHSQHMDIFPGYPGGDNTQTPTAADLINQLTLYSNAAGNTSATGSAVFLYGPYISNMPYNPVNSLTTIKFLAPNDTLTPDGTTGWLYQPSTGQLLPNLTGQDATGAQYTSY